MPVLHEHLDGTWYIVVFCGYAIDERDGELKPRFRTWQIRQRGLDRLRSQVDCRDGDVITQDTMTDLQAEHLVWIGEAGHGAGRPAKPKGPGDHRTRRPCRRSKASGDWWRSPTRPEDLANLMIEDPLLPAFVDERVRKRQAEKAGVSTDFELSISRNACRLGLVVRGIENALPTYLHMASHFYRTIRVRADYQMVSRLVSTHRARWPTRVSFSVPPSADPYQIELLSVSVVTGHVHGELITVSGLCRGGTVFDDHHTRVKSGTVLNWQRPYFLLIEDRRFAELDQSSWIRRGTVHNFGSRSGWTLLLVRFTRSFEIEEREHVHQLDYTFAT